MKRYRLADRSQTNGMNAIHSRSLADTLDAVDEGARREMQYAAPVCEQYVQQNRLKNKYSRLRRLVAERILEKC